MHLATSLNTNSTPSATDQANIPTLTDAFNIPAATSNESSLLLSNGSFLHATASALLDVAERALTHGHNYSSSPLDSPSSLPGDTVSMGNQDKRVDYDVNLDDWDRLCIVAGVCGLLVLVLIVMVCALHPGCPVYKCCPVDYGEGTCRKDKRILGPGYGSMDDPMLYQLPANGHGQGKVQGHAKVEGRVGTGGKIGVHKKTRSMRESSEPSDWSDVSLPEMIELKQDASNRNRKTSRTSDYSSSASSVCPTQPESRIAYGLTFDRPHSRLYIRVIQLGNFRVTDPDGAMSPYVKVRVYRTPRHFFNFKFKSPTKELPLNQLEAEMQTRIQRRTDNPVFNELFEVSVPDSDVSTYTIKFLVCDYDKLSRHVVAGEVSVDLNKVDLSSGSEILANDLVECHHEGNLGDIHVAMMYLPTAEKLSLSILNARGISCPETHKKQTDCIVKIVLMYEGRPLKKTKTSARPNDSNPVFNETFVFDVPAYQLDRVYFHLAVIGIDKDREDGRHLLGRIYMGVNFDPDVRAQWLEMVQHARKQVACWHKLHS